MAAIHTERATEYVTLQCENFQIPQGNLKQLERGRVGFVDMHGRTGVSGLLPDNDPRVREAQERFGSLSAHEIERHNSYMARVSADRKQQVFWIPESGKNPDGFTDIPVGGVRCRTQSSAWTWPEWDPGEEKSFVVEESFVGVDRSRRRQQELDDRDIAYPSSQFFGIMMDSGSTTSVISEHQLMAYRNANGFAPAVQPQPQVRLSSMHGTGKVRGLAELRFPFEDSFRSFHALVSSGDSPLILGLSDHRRLGIVVCALSNTVTFGCGSILPLQSLRGHLFLRWNPADEETLYTSSELRRLHRRFGHPSNEKLLQFLERCSEEDLDSVTKQNLEEIAASCAQCQRGARAPVRFRVSIPSDTFEFNREVITDLFTINGKTAISFVDRDTRFAACRFMDSNKQVKAKDVWRMLRTAWVFPYSGYPDTLRHDRGIQFTASQLQVTAAEAGISATSVGIESANAMGIGERIHGPIRRIYEKLLEEHSDFDDPEFLLMAASKAYNDLHGIDGLVPTLLVFGVYPKIPLPGSDGRAVPNHVRLRIIASARAEYQKIVDERRLKDALVSNRPTPSLPVGLSHGTRVLVYRQTTSRWEPATFLYETGSLVYLRTENRIQPFSRDKVKLAVFGDDHGDDDGPLNILQIPEGPSEAPDAAVTAVPSENPPESQQSPAFDFNSIPAPQDLPALEFEEIEGDARMFYTSPALTN